MENLDSLWEEIKFELDRANRLHQPSFASNHEGYAVILEEMEELWDEIKQKKPSTLLLRVEAIQVVAMGIKFILSLKKNENNA